MVSLSCRCLACDPWDTPKGTADAFRAAGEPVSAPIGVATRMTACLRTGARQGLGCQRAEADSACPRAVPGTLSGYRFSASLSGERLVVMHTTDQRRRW